MSGYNWITKLGDCRECKRKRTVVVAVDDQDFPVLLVLDNLSDSVRWICRECAR